MGIINWMAIDNIYQRSGNYWLLPVHGRTRTMWVDAVVGPLVGSFLLTLIIGGFWYPHRDDYNLLEYRWVVLYLLISFIDVLALAGGVGYFHGLDAS